MMDKKGDGHVDWIISIGIFLIYLLGMFVIIRPGIEPSQDYDTLLDILEENVKEDVNIEFDQGILSDFGGLYWTLYKAPLFFQGFADDVYASCINVDFPYGDQNNIERINAYKIGDDGTKVSLNAELSGNSLSIEEQPGGSWEPNNQYIIYFSDNAVYDDASSGTITEGVICEGRVNANYNLGIVEKTRGVSEKAIDTLNVGSNLANKNYEQVKIIYGYPGSKEFSFIIQSGGVKLEYIPKQPDAKTNIYTRSWGDFILNQDGTRNSITLNIRIW